MVDCCWPRWYVCHLATKYVRHTIPFRVTESLPVKERTLVCLCGMPTPWLKTRSISQNNSIMPNVSAAIQQPFAVATEEDNHNHGRQNFFHYIVVLASATVSSTGLIYLATQASKNTQTNH